MEVFASQNMERFGGDIAGGVDLQPGLRRGGVHDCRAERMAHIEMRVRIGAGRAKGAAGEEEEGVTDIGGRDAEVAVGRKAIAAVGAFGDL